MKVGDPVNETIRAALEKVYCMVVVLTPDQDEAQLERLVRSIRIACDRLEGKSD